MRSCDSEMRVYKIVETDGARGTEDGVVRGNDDQSLQLGPNQFGIPIVRMRPREQTIIA